MNIEIRIENRIEKNNTIVDRKKKKKKLFFKNDIAYEC